LNEPLKHAYAALLAADQETPRVLEMIAAALESRRGPVVDVGCGYGRYLRPLKQRGMEAIGVDVNPEIVKANREAGFASMTPEAFLGSGSKAQVLLMSHVIEHFPPRELFPFMERWLDVLEEGGELVIATPLMGPQFYDDFDHVRPYHPEGLEMVFGERAAQVQYRSRHRLNIVEIAYRRTPWRVSFVGAVFRGGPRAWPYFLMNAIAALLFRLSGGLLGCKTGWIGRFRKLPAPGRQ
jgi:SAM-dependent methyltransferase